MTPTNERPQTPKEQALAALSVIALDVDIAGYLLKNDPNALRQVNAAIPDFNAWVKVTTGPEFNYHCDIGFPPGFNIERYTRHLPHMLVGTDHYEERREKKKLPPRVSKDWVTTKARVVTITRSHDRALLRYAMRGPWGNGTDLTIVIDAGSGYMVTGWFNRTDDWHRLTNTTYARPEEV